MRHGSPFLSLARDSSLFIPCAPPCPRLVPLLILVAVLSPTLVFLCWTEYRSGSRIMSRLGRSTSMPRVIHLRNCQKWMWREFDTICDIATWLHYTSLRNTRMLSSCRNCDAIIPDTARLNLFSSHWCLINCWHGFKSAQRFHLRLTVKEKERTLAFGEIRLSSGDFSSSQTDSRAFAPMSVNINFD